MVDLTIITSALAGIKSATEIAQHLRGANISLDKAETKLKIADLISALADAKIAIADIQGVILEKDQQITELKQAQELKSKAVFEKPYYWLENSDKKDGPRDGPYCQQCYDNDQKLIRLQCPNNNGYWICKTCKSEYKDKTYRTPAMVMPNPINPFGRGY